MRAVLLSGIVGCCLLLPPAAGRAYGPLEPARPAAPSPGVERGDHRRVMLNLRLGAALPILVTLGGPLPQQVFTDFRGPTPVAFSGGPEVGVPIDIAHRFWVILPFETIVFRIPDGALAGQVTTYLMASAGFQYDFGLSPRVLVYPRAHLGYSAHLGPAIPGGVEHLGLFVLEVGIKFVLPGRAHIGVEPLSVPVLFVESVTLGVYRFSAYAGVSF